MYCLRWNIVNIMSANIAWFAVDMPHVIAHTLNCNFSVDGTGCIAPSTTSQSNTPLDVGLRQRTTWRISSSLSDIFSGLSLEIGGRLAELINSTRCYCQELMKKGCIMGLL